MSIPERNRPAGRSGGGRGSYKPLQIALVLYPKFTALEGPAERPRPRRGCRQPADAALPGASGTIVTTEPGPNNGRRSACVD